MAGAEMAVRALQEHGYPYAVVNVSEERVAARSVLVRYRADPGPLAYFGPIEIAGNTSVRDEVIRRELRYRPGERFRRSKIEESQRQLYGLDLFRFASIEVLNAEARPAEVVQTRVTVAEGKPRRYHFSAGYGTEEKVRGELGWRHANLFDARGQWST